MTLEPWEVLGMLRRLIRDPRRIQKINTQLWSRILPGCRLPTGSRYLIIKKLGLKDHDYYGFWGLNPQ